MGVPTALLIEAFATALLGFVIAYAADSKRYDGSVPATPIGLAVFLGAVVAGPFTGGSMNPARSIGPAVAAADLSGVWIYLCAPMLGAAMGMFLHDVFTKRRAGVATAPEPGRATMAMEGER